MSGLLKLKSLVNFETKSVEDSDDLIIEGYANTVDKDRAGDIITDKFWKGNHALKDYKKNPIILAYHDHSKPIGKAIEMVVDERGLRIKARISKGAGPVYDLIKDGILSAFSIGFVVDDAEYNQKDDTFYINKGRVHETSVVSVPCNQESLFSISKSLADGDYKDFEKKFKPAEQPTKTLLKNKGSIMDKSELELMLERQNELNAKAIKHALEAQKANEVAERLELQKEAERAEAKAANAKAISDSGAATQLIKDMEAKLLVNSEAFAKELNARQEEVLALRDDIKSVLAARSNPVTTVTGGVNQGLFEARYGCKESQIDSVVLLGIVTEKNMFETEFGAAHVKAVNASSSIAVSSDEYEELFSTRLMMDIQNRLQLAPLFREIPMSQRSLTIPMHPGFKSQTATWVASAEVNGATRTAATTGSEVALALTEMQIQTHKLAGKTYMTEETVEDAILTLLPLIRENLIMAHANSEEIAILRGTGSGQPEGLITRAAAVAAGAATHITTATFNGSTKVTAKMIHQARRKLGEYGRNITDLTLIISNQAYWDLLEDDQWADVNKVGAENAVKLKGEVGRIYGMSVLVSDWFPAEALGETFGVIFNRQNFIVPRQRGMTVRTDFDIELDRTIIVATQRMNFEQYFANKGVVEITYAAV